jgi:predicted dehydrogenase
MKRPPLSASIPRRDFLKSVTLAGAALGFPTIVPSSVFGQNAPSNRINIGIIGLGGIAKGHTYMMLGNNGVQVMAVCDVDREKRELWKAKVDSSYAEKSPSGSYKGCDAYNEFEHILDRGDIDAVFVCTPDHWHVPISIAAIRSGKDVYVQKPLILTVSEGRQLCDVVKQYGAILQVGSQQRSNFCFRRAAEIVRNGWIGKIKDIQVYLGDFAPPEPLPEQSIPDGFDYDRWLGPTPWFPYNSERVAAMGWRRHWEYGSRINGDWGAHHFDIAQWALGMDESGPVEFMPRNIHGNNLQTHTYANGTTVTRVDNHIPGRLFDEYMIRFIGKSGEVLVARGECLETTPATLVKHPLGSTDVHLYKSEVHELNWLDCIRTRKQPICPAETGYRTATICALSAIAERLARPIRWDPVNEEIVGDEEASRYLDRSRRVPYII